MIRPVQVRHDKGVLGRVGWNLVDQAVWGASNVALAILVARAVPSGEFGYFAIAYGLYTLVLGLSRTAANQPLVIRHSDAAADRFAAAAGSAAGAAVVLGAVASLAFAAAGLVLGGGIRSTFLVMGVLLPGLVLQDCLRTVFICRGRPRQAAVNDLVWTGLMFAALAMLAGMGHSRAWQLIAAWGSAGWLAAALALLQARLLPRVRAGRAWIRANRDLSGFMAAEFLNGYGTFQLALVLVATIGTAIDAGAIRGGQALLGPLAVCSLGAMTFAVPEMVRRGSLLHRGRTVDALLVAGALVSVTLVWGAALLALPAAAGRQLLGDTWEPARDTLLPLTAWIAASSVSFGPISVLQSLGRVRRSYAATAVLAPLLLAGAVLGVSVGGAAGAAWGIAAAQWLVVPLWWWLLRGALNTQVSGVS